MNRNTRQYAVIQRIVIFIGILIVATLTVLDLYLHDFHTVIPNQVYRSRQLSAEQFNAVIHQYGIKSILNLRGANPKNHWYINEIAIAKQDQVNHFDIALKSTQLPSVEDFQKMVTILETAPRPILIHCESGVDRSGLAATVSLLLADAPLQTAEQQESWKYFVLSHESVGKQFLRIYKKWLDENHLTTSKQNFLAWLKQYRPGN